MELTQSVCVGEGCIWQLPIQQPTIHSSPCCAYLCLNFISLTLLLHTLLQRTVVNKQTGMSHCRACLISVCYTDRGACAETPCLLLTLIDDSRHLSAEQGSPQTGDLLCSSSPSTWKHPPNVSRLQSLSLALRQALELKLQE